MFVFFVRMCFFLLFLERGSRRLGESRRRRELASESWRMRGFGFVETTEGGLSLALPTRLFIVSSYKGELDKNRKTVLNVVTV